MLNLSLISVAQASTSSKMMFGMYKGSLRWDVKGIWATCVIIQQPVMNYFLLNINYLMYQHIFNSAVTLHYITLQHYILVVVNVFILDTQTAIWHENIGTYISLQLQQGWSVWSILLILCRCKQIEQSKKSDSIWNFFPYPWVSGQKNKINSHLFEFLKLNFTLI